jgi:hypothetical protein
MNLVDLHRKFYKFPWLACGRYKFVRQSVEMTLHPRENFPEDDPVIASRLEANFNGLIKLDRKCKYITKLKKNTTINYTMQK